MKTERLSARLQFRSAPHIIYEDDRIRDRIILLTTYLQMMTDDVVPRAQYHLALAHESLRAYNHALQKLSHVWDGEPNEFPVDEVSLSWWGLIDAGEREVDASLVKSIAKEVRKRRKQLGESRSTDRDKWASIAVRDFEHTTVENSLDRASVQLKSARDSTHQ